MGADIIGWRNCPLQRELEPEGFLGKLKLRAYKAAIESQVPAEQRAAVRIQVAGTNRAPRELTYGGIVEDLQQFNAGIPECASCPIAGGKALGCYRYVTFPVDAVFEQLVFDFFVEQLPVKDSICDQLYQAVISHVPSSGTGWHIQRPPAAQVGLASLPQPLRHAWGGVSSKKSVDSAQILSGLFVSMKEPAVVVAYVRFFAELSSFARVRGIDAQRSRTLKEVNDALLLFMTMIPEALSSGGQILVDA